MKVLHLCVLVALTSGCSKNPALDGQVEIERERTRLAQQRLELEKQALEVQRQRRQLEVQARAAPQQNGGAYSDVKQETSANEDEIIGAVAAGVVPLLQQKYGYPVDPSDEWQADPKPGGPSVPRVSFSDPRVDAIARISEAQATAKVSVYSVMFNGNSAGRVTYQVDLVKYNTGWKIEAWR